MTERTRVGITGVEGFIGSHLRARLEHLSDVEVVPYRRAFFDDLEQLGAFLRQLLLLHAKPADAL